MTDLAESKMNNTKAPSALPDNDANTLYSELTSSFVEARDIDRASTVLDTKFVGIYVEQGLGLYLAEDQSANRSGVGCSL